MNKAQIVITKFAGILAIAGIIVNSQAVLSKTVTADTVVSSLLCSDSISYVFHQDSLVTMTYHPRIGPITISNAPVISDTFALVAGSNGFSGNLPLSGIDSILFDPSSPPLSVTVRNPSAATISDLAITIFDTTRSVTTLGPNASAAVSFPVVGKRITGAIFGVQVGYTATDTAKIDLELNFNGLVASEITAKDSLISFQKTYSLDYEINDTLKIDYIDIQDGFFGYYFTNHTRLPLLILRGEQLHLWVTSICETQGVDSVEAIAAAFPTYADSFSSGYYFGLLTSGYTPSNPDDSLSFITSNLSGTRLFPIWNPSLGPSGMSVSRAVFTIRNYFPYGNTVTLKSTDSLQFVLRAPSFRNKYRTMLATVRQGYMREGDTAKVKVPSPWNAASKDSLGKNVWADISFIPSLPDSTPYQPRPATIDSLGVTYTFFSPANTATIAQCSAKFLNVRNSMLCMQQSNVTNLMATWPDSIYVAVKVNIPVGTRVLMVNELSVVDTDYLYYMGRMNINGNYTVNIHELTGVVAQGLKKPFNRFDVQYSKDKLIVSIPGTFAGPTEVSLFSLSGRCIKKASLFGRGIIAVPFDRKTARGAYSVIVSNGNVVYKRKIFIQ